MGFVYTHGKDDEEKGESVNAKEHGVKQSMCAKNNETCGAGDAKGMWVLTQKAYECSGDERNPHKYCKNAHLHSDV